MTGDEFLQWFADRPRWPAPDESMIREMETLGYTFAIVEDAPFITAPSPSETS